MLLYLFYHEHVVGTITAKGEVLLFNYADSWLNFEKAFPLSCRIPLTKQEYAEPASLFFQHLLPERNIIERMAHREGFDPDDLFQCLDHLGRDCAGAFVIASSSSLPEKTQRKRIDAHTLTRFLKADLLELDEDEVPKKLSLAGAQDKMPVIVSERQLYTSSELDPSTHIIKFPILASRLFENLSVNELYCTHIAAASGLEVVQLQPIALENENAILSERYDRKVWDHGVVQRLHQEDFCQATGKREKYEFKPGGVTLGEVVSTLQHCSFPAIEIQKLVEWLVFNVIIRNGDNHAKNLSLLYDNGATSMAPFYDLICTGIYGRKWDTNMAFAIGEIREPDKMVMSKWSPLAAIVDFSEGEVMRKVKDVIERVSNAIHEYHGPFSEHPTALSIKKLMKKQIKGMSR